MIPFFKLTDCVKGSNGTAKCVNPDQTASEAV